MAFSLKKETKAIGITYLVTWVLMLGFFVLVMLINGNPFTELFGNLKQLLSLPRFWVALHVIFLFIYLLFLLFRFFVRTYKRKGPKVFLKRFSIGLLLPILLLYGSVRAIIFYNTNESYTYTWDKQVENYSCVPYELYQIDGKHRGMSVFGWNRTENTSSIESLIQNNVEWVAVTPFLYQSDEGSLDMRSPTAIGEWSKRDSTFIKAIHELHDRRVKVHLKPHVWLGQGWRSNISLSDQEEWNRWFDTYETNMLHYAHMAAFTNAELFCIGTELKTTLTALPNRWVQLVTKIKEIYPGKLTYAANWDGEFKKVPFWNEMDYVGVQAYFPLTKSNAPEITAIEDGWSKHITMLKVLHEQYQKPILFTEVGYKSEATATISPWEWGDSFDILFAKRSYRTQQYAYEALFNKLWDEGWFAGMYIWQWDNRYRGPSNGAALDFTPQYKPAQNTIAKWYGTLGAIDASHKTTNPTTP